MKYETHDPKCPAMNKQLTSPTICSYCQIIRSVRAEYETTDVEGHPF